MPFSAVTRNLSPVTTAPEDFGVKMQPLSQSMQDEVAACGTKFLGGDFGATIDVAYWLYNTGQAYAPTVVNSDANFRGRLLQAIRKPGAETKAPGTYLYFRGVLRVGTTEGAA